MRPNLKAHGFTLVEVLVALALMAVLAVLSWRGLDTMVRTREVTQSRIDQVAVAQISLTQWRADLDAMLVLPGVVNDNSMQWDGRVMRLLRRSATPLPNGQDAGMKVVAWTVRDGHWLRWQSADLTQRADINQAWQQASQWGQNPSSEALRQQAQLMPLGSWRVFYFRENAWSNPLSSAGGVNQDLLKTPDGVRIELQLDAPGALDKGRLTIDWVRASFNPTRS
jgi:general secretion pathway protein J